MYGKNQHDVIYGESSTDYEAALQTGKIEKLSERRLKRCLDFFPEMPGSSKNV